VAAHEPQILRWETRLDCWENVLKDLAIGKRRLEERKYHHEHLPIKRQDSNCPTVNVWLWPTRGRVRLSRAHYFVDQVPGGRKLQSSGTTRFVLCDYPLAPNPSSPPDLPLFSSSHNFTVFFFASLIHGFSPDIKPLLS